MKKFFETVIWPVLWTIAGLVFIYRKIWKKRIHKG